MQAKDIIFKTNYIIDQSFELLEGEFDKKQAKRLYKDTVIFEKRLAKLLLDSEQTKELSNISNLDLEDFEEYCNVLVVTVDFLQSALKYPATTEKGYFMFIKNICASTYIFNK